MSSHAGRSCGIHLMWTAILARTHVATGGWIVVFFNVLLDFLEIDFFNRKLYINVIYKSHFQHFKANNTDAEQQRLQFFGISIVLLVSLRRTILAIGIIFSILIFGVKLTIDMIRRFQTLGRRVLQKYINFIDTDDLLFATLFKPRINEVHSDCANLLTMKIDISISGILSRRKYLKADVIKVDFVDFSFEFLEIKP